jgi:hypothetical protein
LKSSQWFIRLFILASLKTIFVDRAENILVVLKAADQLPTLKRIVMTKKLSDEQESEIRKKANDMNIELFTYSQLRVSQVTC